MRHDLKCCGTLAAALGVLVALAPGPARADVSGEAILRALVKKGILTSAEADAVRTDAEREQRKPAAPAPVVRPAPKAQPAAGQTSVTGYVQARAVIQSNVRPSSNLFVRRARLNLLHRASFGRFALSFDGGQNTTTVKDAYFDLFITRNKGARQGWMLRSGQFFRPFGFEIERSALDREFPERPAGWAALFPGNRDQGFDLSVGVTPSTRVNLAVVNGNGTSIPSLSFRDTDNHKDLIARIQQTFASPHVELALSGYWGRQTIPGAPAIPAQLGFVDSNGNGRRDPGEPVVVVAPGRPATLPITGDRERWGLAANVYSVAGGTLRGEFVAARDLTLNLGAGPTLGTANARAWYLLYAHPVGHQYTVAIRYDTFDPDTQNALRLGGDGEQRTLGFALLRSLGANIKLSLALEQPRQTVYDKVSKTSRQMNSDALTMQGQFRF